MDYVYEVIWSWARDKYIVRPVCTWSSITPNFIGTYDECIAHLRNCFPH